MRQTKLTFQHTIYGCYVGYIVQAVVNNFIPLLFLNFQSVYHIPLTKITLLITFNFVVQLLVDLLSAGFVDRLGYRACMLLAHVFSAVGLIGLDNSHPRHTGQRFCRRQTIKRKIDRR